MLTWGIVSLSISLLTTPTWSNDPQGKQLAHCARIVVVVGDGLLLLPGNCGPRDDQEVSEIQNYEPKRIAYNKIGSVTAPRRIWSRLRTRFSRSTFPLASVLAA